MDAGEAGKAVRQASLERDFEQELADDVEQLRFEREVRDCFERTSRVDTHLYLKVSKIFTQVDMEPVGSASWAASSNSLARQITYSSWNSS